MNPGETKEMSENSHSLEFSWLVRLRWWVSLILLVALYFIHASSFVHMNLWGSLSVVIVYWISNLLSHYWFRRVGKASNTLLGCTMLMDVLLITALLAFSGGAQNPFSFLYLIPLSTSVLLLPQGFTWGILVLSFLGYGSLFLFDIPLTHAGRGMGGHLLHLYGMWFAFGLSALYIVYFMLHINGSLKARTKALEGYRERERRNHHLTALGTLAAGAAHELSTPLSTIAIISKELEYALKKFAPENSQNIEDTKILREEVNRCREILQKMRGRSNNLSKDSPENTELLSFLERAIEGREDRIKIPESDRLRGRHYLLPRETLRIAIENVLKNALQSDSENHPVEIEVREKQETLEIHIVDAGEGMDPEVLRHLGEPFFTTKKVGEGVGLGIYLSRAILEQVGGELVFDAGTKAGTRAVLRLPLESREKNEVRS